MTHQWDDEMGEISGFGGGYEAVCRAMVRAGMQWVDEHPEANPSYKSLKGVFGLIDENNEDAVSLRKAMMDAPVYWRGELIQKRAGDDCTGAMYHAAVEHVRYYAIHGWEKYREQMLKSNETEEHP